jgi:hypothetical protein
VPASQGSRRRRAFQVCIGCPAPFRSCTLPLSLDLCPPSPGLFRGWFPTLIGYSAQGAGKFGLYEYFKKTYADIAGPELTARYQSLIFLAGSASAEFFADIALCPFEAVKVKVQTVPGYAKGFSDGSVSAPCCGARSLAD